MEHNTLSLNNKTVLITGGAKRIGAEVTRRLHEEGCNIVLHFRNSKSDAVGLAAKLNDQRPDSVRVIQADLSNNASVPTLVYKTLDYFGNLDILINNASSFYPTPVGQITEADWNDLFASNLKAPLFLSQAAAKALRQSRGIIINMVDIHAKKPLREYSVYCAAKAGLLMLTKSLAQELAPEIRVNAIAPGPILWPEQDYDVDKKDKVVNATALKRMGHPKDIAEGILFLIEGGKYITGQCIAIDGGRSVGW